VQLQPVPAPEPEPEHDLPAAAPATRGAAGLYAIIAFKLGKGLLLLLLALGLYSLVDELLAVELERWLRIVRIDPEREFFDNLAARLAAVTPATLGWIALGTLAYSLFSLIEGVGLWFRAGWAGWLAIGESAFFIPIELHHLMQRPSTLVTLILAVNVAIVVYLFRNRNRLLHHWHR
jgi:uncharacterized membrane protein (DUF2068 family)